jgi:GNAT superfamily N-acetyltransferase
VLLISAFDGALTARIAKPSDHKQVARLCKRAVGSRDYALGILKEVIADKGLFLGWSNDELVGMVNFDECVDGSGWLSMGRTDPDWRRRGVALFLQQRVAVCARQRGIEHLRLWALSNNRPSILAATKGGFRPVCEATHVTSSISGARKLRQTRPPRSTYEGSLKDLMKSLYLSKMNGYFAYKWHFVKANEELLRTLLDKGELIAKGTSVFILTHPEMSFGDRRSAFSLLHGTLASALGEVKLVANYSGRLFLGSYWPYDTYLRAVAQKNGFRRDSWGKHCIVFEKGI